VGIEHSISDHRYIELTITLDCPPAENITNLRLTNWGFNKNLLNRKDLIPHNAKPIKKGKEKELLSDTHFPKNTHVVEDLHIEENLDDQCINNISNPGRIQWAVNSFKPFKSPGPDGFLPTQIQRTLDILYP